MIYRSTVTSQIVGDSLTVQICIFNLVENWVRPSQQNSTALLNLGKALCVYGLVGLEGESLGHDN